MPQNNIKDSVIEGEHEIVYAKPDKHKDDWLKTPRGWKNWGGSGTTIMLVGRCTHDNDESKENGND